eukprot:9064067-Pyramimonas_sp.AAC.3
MRPRICDGCGAAITAPPTARILAYGPTPRWTSYSGVRSALVPVSRAGKGDVISVVRRELDRQIECRAVRVKRTCTRFSRICHAGSLFVRLTR